MRKLKTLLIILLTMPCLAAIHSPNMSNVVEQQREIVMNIQDENQYATFAHAGQIYSKGGPASVSVEATSWAMKSYCSKQLTNTKLDLREGISKAGRSLKKGPRSDINKLH